MDFSMIVIMAVVTEGIISYVKSWVVDKKIKWQMIAAVVLGVIISVCYGLDIPALVGADSHLPFVGSVITGILISRGSNYIYDLINAFKPSKNLNTNYEREI